MQKKRRRRVRSRCSRQRQRQRARSAALNPTIDPCTGECRDNSPFLLRELVDPETLPSFSHLVAREPFSFITYRGAMIMQ